MTSRIERPIFSLTLTAYCSGVDWVTHVDAMPKRSRDTRCCSWGGPLRISTCVGLVRDVRVAHGRADRAIETNVDRDPDALLRAMKRLAECVSSATRRRPIFERAFIAENLAAALDVDSDEVQTAIASVLM
jgi:hypothetical protein